MLECEVCIDGIHLEHILEFKYLGLVMEQLIGIENQKNRCFFGELESESRDFL